MTSKYIAKRFLLSFFLLLCISFVIYCLVWFMPGDFVSSRIAGNMRANEQIKLQLIRLYGLDKGLIAGFASWIGSALCGDFGISFLYQKPVMTILAEKLKITLPLCMAALFFQLFISLVFGIVSSYQKGKVFDKMVSFLSMAGCSVPIFLMAILLQKWLSFDTGLLPLGGMVSVRSHYTGALKMIDMIKHMVMPVLVLVLAGLPGYIKLIRSEMIRVLSSGYILASRARGASEFTVVFRHALPNILPSLLSFVGRSAPALITGTLIVEQIFAIDGIGQAAFLAFSCSDIPFTMGFCVIMSGITLMITIFEDILCAACNPYMRIAGGEKV